MPVNGNATLIVNSQSFPIEPIGWSPSVNVYNRPIVVAKEYGCHEVSMPAVNLNYDC